MPAVGELLREQMPPDQVSWARSPKEDPTRPHVAFAVADLAAAKAELARRDIAFRVYDGLVGAASEQVFFEDPFGNMIELQQD